MLSNERRRHGRTGAAGSVDLEGTLSTRLSGEEEGGEGDGEDEHVLLETGRREVSSCRLKVRGCTHERA